jgi:hypothetical protein
VNDVVGRIEALETSRADDNAYRDKTYRYMSDTNEWQRAAAKEMNANGATAREAHTLATENRRRLNELKE